MTADLRTLLADAFHSDPAPAAEAGLEVAVPCDAQPGCGPAWQTVDGREDLTLALDGEAADPMCPRCGAP